MHHLSSSMAKVFSGFGVRSNNSKDVAHLNVCLHFLNLVAFFLNPTPAVSTHTEGEDKIQVLLMVACGRYVSKGGRGRGKKPVLIGTVLAIQQQYALCGPVSFNSAFCLVSPNAPYLL